MIRNCRKIRPSGTGAALPPSFMALRRVAVQPVDHRRLGDAERQPILHLLLQRDIEPRAELARRRRNRLAAVEPKLEGELADQRAVLATRAPERHVALADHPLAEIE